MDPRFRGDDESFAKAVTFIHYSRKSGGGQIPIFIIAAKVVVVRFQSSFPPPIQALPITH
jgi:hypothetical protein